MFGTRTIAKATTRLADKAGSRDGRIEIKGEAKGAFYTLAALGAVGAAGLLYGWLDYMAHPECFREGERPAPAEDCAPGTATISMDEFPAGTGAKEIEIRFTAGPGGISEDGGVRLCHCRIDHSDGGRVPEPVLFSGWGILQNSLPFARNYFSCELQTEGSAQLEVKGKGLLPISLFLRGCARELLRYNGVKLDPVDYRYLYLDYSRIVVSPRGARINEGDVITFRLGDRSRGSSGWRTPQVPGTTEFLVEVDERALGLYSPIRDVPVITVGEKRKDRRRVFSDQVAPGSVSSGRSAC